MKKMKYGKAIKVVEEATDKMVEEMDELGVGMHTGVMFALGWSHAIDVVKALVFGELDADSDEVAVEVARTVKEDEDETSKGRDDLFGAEESCEKAADALANAASEAFVDSIRKDRDELVAMFLSGMAQGASFVPYVSSGQIEVDDDFRRRIVETGGISAEFYRVAKETLRSAVSGKDFDETYKLIKNLVEIVFGDADAL